MIPFLIIFMCFTVINPKIQIAKEDIIVYKTMCKTNNPKKYTSYHRYFPYEDGYHYYNENFPKKVAKGDKLHGEGLHSFRLKAYIKYYIGNGDSLIPPTVLPILCRIPKGAKYLRTKYYYFSSDLVVDGVITK